MGVNRCVVEGTYMEPTWLFAPEFVKVEVYDPGPTALAAWPTSHCIMSLFESYIMISYEFIYLFYLFIEIGQL